MPASIGRVLSLVRRLIDYGRQLAATVQQRAAAPGFAVFAMPFGTADLAAILARIANGLRRAAALEARLNQRAARGRDLAPSPLRLAAAHRPRAACPSTEPQADQAQDPRLALLPTEAEIAARLAAGLDPVVRTRPIGAVIADICRDLGIAPGNLTREFWDEIALAIIAYGGRLAGFLGDLNKRLFAYSMGERAGQGNPPWPAAPQRLPEPATGPP